MRRFAALARSVALAGILAGAACTGAARVELPIQTSARTGVADASYSAAIRQSDEVVSSLTSASPAISVAVAVNGSLVWSAAYGFRDLERRIPAVPEDRFRVYSLAKVLTATAMMALVERGALDLDAPINRYVPAFPNPDGGITIRRLAGHLGGIRHYRSGEALWTRSCRTVDDAVAVFKGDPLQHPPGTKYLYSSWGYVLLSRAIEAASGSPFSVALDRLVIEPAQMTHTALEHAGGSVPSTVTPYEPDGSRARIARAVDNSCKWGAGAYVSTAEDLARFGASLLAGKLIKNESLQQMLMPMPTTSGESTDYGMGLGVTRDSTGRLRAVHSGSAIGGRATLYMLPDDGIVVVLMSNVEGERLTGAAAVVARHFRTRP